MPQIKEVLVPDIGDFDEVDVIEVLVKPGDQINKEDSMITLESDKATMEIPSPWDGVVKELKVKVGDKVAQNSPILTMETMDRAPSPEAGEEKQSTPVEFEVREASEQIEPTAGIVADRPLPEAPARTAPPVVPTSAITVRGSASAKAHASPSVRHFARELGVDLGLVKGSGTKGRILKEDVQGFVKGTLSGATATGSGGISLLAAPPVDFTKFGEIETRPLTKIKKLTAQHVYHSWMTVPQVTQFDEVDISELEAFRKSQSGEAAKKNIKLTLLSFFLKAAAVALQEFPEFNSSLASGGGELIIKKYFHIGIAVDTPDGLVVPVIRDVDQKGLFDLAEELQTVSAKAREKKLTPSDLQGGCFTISSLGGIGGTAFTPIVNAPEVAILGISRSTTKPVFQNGKFQPRTMLPFSVSYDHRVIDGAAAARFTKFLSTVLSDIRQLLL